MIGELKKAIKEQKLVYGARETIKKLKLGEVKVVFLASNCSPELKEDIRRYSKLSEIQVHELDIPDTEIGMMCKRMHLVSVLSY
ncbi:MAG: ribosomal L7Ae/L30e/S12e/Gadd45 family protein [Candidatus Woesearchaeota archaeon]